MTLPRVWSVDREPIVYNDKEPSANARANLWWRHEPFPGETSIALRDIPLRPCAGKAGVAKRSWWRLCIIPSNRCCQFSMISQIWKKFTFNRAQDVVRKALVYYTHCGACWSQGSHSNSAREISRAIFALGGVGRHVVLSVCYTKLS